MRELDLFPARWLEWEPAGTCHEALFKSAPKVPAPPPVVEMPDPMSPAILDRQRSLYQRASATSGRESTVLTGDNYSGSTLGTR